MATATASAGPGPPACATPSHQPKKDRKSLVWDFAIDRVGIRPFERKREKEILRKLEEDEPDHESKLYVTPIKSDVEGFKQPTFRAESATWRATRRFLKLRGWKEWTPKDGGCWNLYWRENRVQPFVIERCFMNQRINKLRDTNGMTLKDELALGLREMVSRFGGIYQISPNTWVLPEEEESFEDHLRLESKKGNGNKSIYICKPARLSRGRNIFLFQTKKQLEKHIFDNGSYKHSRKKEIKEVEKWVIQSYLTNPFLISGYKFDLRLYVLVSSVWPLKAFLYKRGLVRFATSKFDLSDSTDLYAHLTNSSINKSSSTLNADKGVIGKGCKWRLQKLLKHLKEAGQDTDLLWQRIKTVVLLTLLPLVGNVAGDPASFEYFGFDVMLDSNLRPYVIEVNSGPAMSVNMEQDKIVKIPMLDDMFNLLRLDELPSLPLRPHRPKTRKVRPKKRTTGSDGKKLRGESEISEKSPEISGKSREEIGKVSGSAEIGEEEKSGEAREGRKEMLDIPLDLSRKGDWDIVFPFHEKSKEDSESLANKFNAKKGKGAMPETMQKLIDGFLMRTLDSIKASYTTGKPW